MDLKNHNPIPLAGTNSLKKKKKKEITYNFLAHIFTWLVSHGLKQSMFSDIFISSFDGKLCCQLPSTAHTQSCISRKRSSWNRSSELFKGLRLKESDLHNPGLSCVAVVGLLTLWLTRQFYPIHTRFDAHDISSTALSLLAWNSPRKWQHT